MNRKNFSDCFDLLALAAVLFVVAIGCGPKYRDDLDRRDRDFSAISAEKSQPERRSDNQKQKPQSMPRPMKQRTR
jgi:hypothetical protein